MFERSPAIGRLLGLNAADWSILLVGLTLTGFLVVLV
jgi:hypothetical protein